MENFQSIEFSGTFENIPISDRSSGATAAARATAAATAASAFEAASSNLAGHPPHLLLLCTPTPHWRVRAVAASLQLRPHSRCRITTADDWEGRALSPCGVDVQQARSSRQAVRAPCHCSLTSLGTLPPSWRPASSRNGYANYLPVTFRGRCRCSPPRPVGEAIQRRKHAQGAARPDQVPGGVGAGRAHAQGV